MDKGSSERFVLAIDDDYETTVLLEHILKKLTYLCRTVQTGEDALRLLRSDPDDVGLVLLDLAMPEFSGFDICRAIRADPSLEGIPIVALTASVETHSIDKAFEAGVDELVKKPFKHNDLERVLSKFFRH